MDRKDIKKPRPENVDQAIVFLDGLRKTEPSDEFIKAVEATEEYEEMQCVCPMTGTVEIMKRKL
jgi:hypothetical protein